MEDIYDDLENFNDVNVVNELRTENEELKQKLGQYADSMASLQKDFDNLSAEFKKLETNYSSLLKSARAEIKRKTDMIKNLNIEKDTLVLKQFQGKPDHRQKLMNVYKVKAEGTVKKKNNPNKAVDPKQREEFRKSPSENSSTATEKSNKSLSTEDRVRDSLKSTAKNTSKENEIHPSEVFPNHREKYHDDRLQGGGVTDRRISTLTSQQFLKFSSDEEFEDLYSALEPKTTSKGTSFGDEAQKGQKRFRGEPQHSKVYNESSGPHDKRLNYTDIPRDRFNKNCNRRFYENERNMNRDKHDLPHPFRNKYSPERGRYGKRDFGEDRFLQKYDRHRWMENSGERYQHKYRERRPYPDRGRSDQNPDMDMNKYSDPYTGKHKLASSTQIHGEYDQPPIKRFRGDEYPHTDQDRRRNDKHFPNEYPSSEMREAYRQTQSNDEFVNSIYADLDKPTSDSVMLPGDDNIIKGNQEINHDKGIERDVAGTHDPHSTKKDLNKSKVWNDKDNLRSKHTEEKINEGEKSHTITKYKIPLKGLKVNTDELSKTKSNEDDTIINRGENTRSSKPHKDLPSVNDCIKISEVAKTVESSELTSKANAISLPAKISKIGKKETEGSTSFERALEQKLSSIRNIVEGDLELSDETNDDTQAQLKENELPDTKKKHKTKKKSRKDSSKNKISTKKSKSGTDKDKDVKAKNKFSELFGDSSLITPEDLELAPTPASTQSADTYAAVCEDAQDGISLQDKQNNVRTLAAKKEIIGPEPNAICPQTDSLRLEEKNKMIESKDNKSRGDHIKDRKSEVLLIDDVKDPKEINLSNIVNSPTTDSVKTTLLPEVEKPVSSEISKEQLDRNKSEKKIKNDVKTPLIPEVKTTPSDNKSKETPKVTKLDKKTRGDSIPSLLTSEVNTAAKSDKSKEIYVNKPDQITKGNIVETYLMSKVKAVATSEESTDIFNVSKPEKKAESNVVETHLMPKVKAVASVEKSKEILNVSKPDRKTKIDVVETHFIPEVKGVESIEKSEEVLNINIPHVKIKNDVVKTHVIPGLGALASCETSKEMINITKSDNKNNPNAETPINIELKPAVSREKSKEIRNVTNPEKKTKGGALKCDEKNKDHKKSNKKPKSNEDKMFPSGEVEKESHITKNQSIAEQNKPIIKSSNKENESCGEVSEGTMNSDLPTFFEDTLVPVENISIDKNKTDEDKLTVNMVPKESDSNTRIDNTPNLEAVTEDAGLVNTVVISSGVQPADTNALQVNTTESQYTSLKALATSTPTRELSTFNTLSEIKPYTNTLTSSVNVKTANDNLVSKNDESDIPDVRIYCYRRRRKLVR